ncbi:MAG: BON domain-containing protein [Pseudomonadota bacterium]
MSKYGHPVLRTLAKGLVCAAMLSSLSGCVGLVVGGAVAGAVATNDRRSLGTQTDDKTIAIKGEVRAAKISGEIAHVNVNSFNRQVLLTGEVRDEAMKAELERDIKAIPGVISVANELVVAGPASYTSRSADALITAKVKASLVEMKTISASSFKVVTERGIVYLLGRVSQREGALGAEIARGVGGVQKVVKIFDYISEDEVKALSPTQSVAL